jgi:hypothetical protein
VSAQLAFERVQFGRLDQVISLGADPVNPAIGLHEGA